MKNIIYLISSALFLTACSNSGEVSNSTMTPAQRDEMYRAGNEAFMAVALAK